MAGCTGPEGMLAIKYFTENWLGPELISMSEVVVPTDDPINPYKTLYLGETTQNATERALRPPDVQITSSYGYSYWDYCYTRNNEISMKTPPRTVKCSALRLFFDNNSLLYDYEHVVRSRK